MKLQTSTQYKGIGIEQNSDNNLAIITRKVKITNKRSQAAQKKAANAQAINNRTALMFERNIASEQAKVSRANRKAKKKAFFAKHKAKSLTIS